MRSNSKTNIKNLRAIYDFRLSKKEPVVSVHIFVYNHEKYLERCLNSVFNQKVDFGVEVVIHDDCSTDKSLDICHKYSQLYPDHTILLTEERNLYSKSCGVLEIEKKLLSISRGLFIAFCEGDDYWLDEYKLFNQYRAMMAHPEICFCVHDVLVNNDINGQKSHLPSRRYKNGIIKSKKFIGIINKKYSFQTSSFFVKADECRSFHDAPPSFSKSMPTNDESWLLYYGSRTNVLYLNKTMSCYNKLSDNSWTSKANSFNKAKKKEQRLLVVRSIEQFDIYTNFLYRKSCQRRIAYNLLMNFINDDDFKAIFSNGSIAKELWHYNFIMFIKKWIKTYVFKK